LTTTGSSDASVVGSDGPSGGGDGWQNESLSNFLDDDVVDVDDVDDDADVVDDFGVDTLVAGYLLVWCVESTSSTAHGIARLDLASTALASPEFAMCKTPPAQSLQVSRMHTIAVHPSCARGIDFA